MKCFILRTLTVGGSTAVQLVPGFASRMDSTASLHTNSHILSSLVKSSLVKLETTCAAILSPLVSVLCIIQPIRVFLKMGHPRPLSRFIFVFSNKHYNSKNKCWDSNPRPSEHESPPITTRPGFPPIRVFYNIDPWPG